MTQADPTLESRAQPEAAVASLLAQLDAAHISLEGGGDHV